jgi:phosphoserine phosphatase RsbU/P
LTETMVCEAMEKTECAIPKILIADDQPDVLEALRLLLKNRGYEIETTSSPAGVLEALQRREFDLLLMDLNYARDTTSGREGLDMVARVMALENAPPIVVMTGWGSVNLAVETMQRGVKDFVQKPWENARLLEILGTQVEMGRTRREQQRLDAKEKARSNEMAGQLHRQEQEIGEARSIQERFLPAEIPQIAGYEIAGSWQPARVVGGDYYDVLKFSEESIGLCIADVAGKGMAAALLMSNFQATVRGVASEWLAPDELCERCNRFIARNITEDRFITCFYGQLRATERKLTYTNAGHNGPILLRKDGSYCRLQSGGSVLGIFPEQRFERGEVELLPGDRLVLFTDGVTEAADGMSDDFFGEDRLLNLLVQHRALRAEELQEKIMKAIAEFSKGEFHDDATVVVLAVE